MNRGQPAGTALSPWKIGLAFAAVYVLWGSTYLAIRIGVETFPPLLLAAVRMTTAGWLLYGWLRWRGAPQPTGGQWRAATVIGGLMLLVGNGGVCWAERTVPSGLASLLTGTTPLWMALLGWLWQGTARPTGRMIAGVALGFVGAGLLVAPGQFAGGSQVDPLGAVALVFATVGWATGALYSRRANLPKSALLGAAMQMICGGALLLLVSGLVGEWPGFAWGNVSGRSWGAVVYLVLFGSLVGYSAYMWLLQVSTPARVSTTAYVNPVIAVLVGWFVAGESITGRIVLAAGIIVVAVVLIISQPAAPVTEPV